MIQNYTLAQHNNLMEEPFSGRVGNAAAYGHDELVVFGQGVIEKIRTFVEAGYTTIVLRFTSPHQRAQLERCVTEVLPAFAGSNAARLTDGGD